MVWPARGLGSFLTNQQLLLLTATYPLTLLSVVTIIFLFISESEIRETVWRNGQHSFNTH